MQRSTRLKVISTRKDNRNTMRIAVLLMAIHSTLLAWSAYKHSPVVDEVGHLAAGISHWELGHFNLYRVNPPLVRAVAAIPILLTDYKIDWGQLSNDVYERPEFEIGRRFCEINGPNVFWFFTLSRLVCIPLSLIGAWFCFRWSRDLFGDRGGLLSLTLWCFSPNVIAWGSTICPDVGAASFGVMASYSFWRWLQRPAWSAVLVAGITLGLALLTKTTWILLLAIWPLLWTTHRIACKQYAQTGWKSGLAQLLSILAVGLYLVNLGYGFENTGKQLKDYRFVSKTLGGDGHKPGNYFEGLAIGGLPVPLPENYLQGIDIQKREFENRKWSYLRGEHKFGGWWYYYIYGLIVKEPVLTWGIVVAAVCVSLPFRLTRCINPAHPTYTDQMSLLVPGLAVLALVSTQTGFNHHIRYVLPFLPFLFIWSGKLLVNLPELAGGHERKKSRLILGMPTLALLAVSGSVFESMWIYPHSMSFFNFAAGGPISGPNHLLDSNIDWGQDLLLVREWALRNPSAQPIILASSTSFATQEVLNALSPSNVEFVFSDSSSLKKEVIGARPAWWVINVNLVHGYPADRPPQFSHLRNVKPFCRIGYTFLVYKNPPRSAVMPKR